MPTIYTLGAEFALSENVKNTHFEGGRGARRAIVGLFGEGWVHGRIRYGSPPKKTVIP
jgi:hypothetical protein